MALEVSQARMDEDRAQAVALIARIYQKSGYAKPGGESAISTWLSSPSAATFAARIGETLLGTITVIGDSPAGLPMDSLFKDLVDPLRKEAGKLAEVGQFAIDRELVREFQKEHPREALDRAISLSLFRAALSYGLRQQFDLFCITVNPKHEAFYRSVGFEVFGETRSYPSVENAPAVPMRLDLSRLEIERAQGEFANSFLAMLLASKEASRASG